MINLPFSITRPLGDFTAHPLNTQPSKAGAAATVISSPAETLATAGSSGAFSGVFSP